MKLIEFNIEEFPNVVFVVSVTFLFLWTLELSTDWFCSPIIAIIISLFFAMHPQMRQQRNRYFHKLAHESKTGDQMMKSGVGHFKKTKNNHSSHNCSVCNCVTSQWVFHFHVQKPNVILPAAVCSQPMLTLFSVLFCSCWAHQLTYSWRDQHFMSLSNILHECPCIMKIKSSFLNLICNI